MITFPWQSRIDFHGIFPERYKGSTAECALYQSAMQEKGPAPYFNDYLQSKER
jgi:hypothetical protein